MLYGRQDGATGVHGQTLPSYGPDYTDTLSTCHECLWEWGDTHVHEMRHKLILLSVFVFKSTVFSHTILLSPPVFTVVPCYRTSKAHSTFTFRSEWTLITFQLFLLPMTKISKWVSGRLGYKTERCSRKPHNYLYRTVLKEIFLITLHDTIIGTNAFVGQCFQLPSCEQGLLWLQSWRQHEKEVTGYVRREGSR